MRSSSEVKGLSLDDSLTIAGDVVWRELAGEAVILSMETGHYFGLNDVGARMWQLICERRSLQRVFEGLLDEYDVEPACLEHDLLALASTLCAHRLAQSSRRRDEMSGQRDEASGRPDEASGRPDEADRSP